MAKKTQIERAIEGLDGEIAVLQAARVRLVAQQQAKPARKPRVAARVIDTAPDPRD